MPGKPVQIGPFKDGLNNISLSGEAKDTELVEMANFEVGQDSLLWSRPPFEAVTGTSIPGNTITATWKVLGIYRTSTTEWYLLCLKPKAAGAADLIAVLSGDFVNTPIVIKSLTAGNTVAAFVQIDNDCYFCVTPTSTIAGFKWAKGGSATDIAAMKKGNCMVAFQSRLWIAGIDTALQSSTVYFSSIGTSGPDPTVWNATDFIRAAPGEGGFITALLALNSSILIFKNDGTWRFTYPSAPSKGQVSKVSGSIGAAGATSVVEFENYVYVYDQGRLYELVNNNFTILNRFVRFDDDDNSAYGATLGVDVSVMNRRVLVRYRNNMYAYSVDSRSWSQWRSYIGLPGKLYELPADSSTTLASTYVGASVGMTQNVSANIIPAFTPSYRAFIGQTIGTGHSITDDGTTYTVNTAATGTPSKVILNTEESVKGYNIMLSGGQQWKLTGTVTKTGGTLTANLVCLLRDGTLSTVSQTLNLDAVDKTFTSPDNTIAAYLTIEHTVTVPESYTLNGFQFVRIATNAPASLIAIKDTYADVPVTVEYITCTMRTKSYDFSAPSVFKRLFWWGADVKTTLLIKAKLIPMAIKAPPTWGDLKAYTHLQLKAGTWGNPLSFLGTNLTVADGGNPANSVTENGRIFVKLIKSLRFKQVSFELELLTLGTQATGPVKVHTITSYIMPKEKVVDKFN